MTTKLCKTCGLRGVFQNGQWGCSKFQIPIDLDKDFCSWHQSENDITTCDFCHSKVNLNQTIIVPIEDHNLIVCKQCYGLLGHCATCTYINDCGFDKDHSMPHTVMHTIQQGMMTMQTQIKNPALVEKHCTSCRCHVDGKCLRDSTEAICNSWSIQPELLRPSSQ